MKAKEERDARKAARHGRALPTKEQTPEAQTPEVTPPPAPPRQQPKKQSRSQRKKKPPAGAGGPTGRVDPATPDPEDDPSS
jgi:YidC/Oxa1 family membrane protein insertase